MLSFRNDRFSPSGTDGSNPLSSRGESANFWSLSVNASRDHELAAMKSFYALRSRTLTAYPQQEMVVAEDVGVRVAQRRGMRRAIVAVARRLAVVLHPDRFFYISIVKANTWIKS